LRVPKAVLLKKKAKVVASVLIPNEEKEEEASKNGMYMYKRKKELKCISRRSEI